MTEITEKPLIFLQYAGGKSRPHEVQDRTGNWGRFFEAQTLVHEPLPPEVGYRQVVMKTSEISPTGVMVIEASGKGKREIKNIGETNEARVSKHLALVKKTMLALQEICPEARVYLWHTNATDKPSYEKPADLGKPRKGIPINTSQTIATMHSHCDALSGEEFLSIFSLSELEKVHREHLGSAASEDEVQAFMTEQRRKIKPRVFYRFFLNFWKEELMPRMIKVYPDLFEQIDKQKLHQEVSLPAVSLKLKGGFDSLDNPDFVKATRLVHNSVMAGWKEFSIFIRDLVKIKSRTEDKKQIDRRIDEYVKVHPWAKKYRQRFFSLARIIKVDRRRVPDRADWLHKGFNFTQGVVQWREEPAIFFVDIGADVKTGVQSVRVHSIRESHELTQPKVEERMQFRTRLIKNLRERDSRLEIGPEGKYTLQTFKENP